MIRALCILGLVLTGPAWADETRVPQSPAEISLSFTPVVKRAAPAVVNIYARRIVNTRSSPFSDDPFFQNLFRDFGVPRQRVENSLGSGVILSEDGIVVSNYHVVAEATDIRVVLNDRREYSASVLLADEESDLAVLRLEDAPEMPALKLRDSDTVEVGELVLAIGNPFGVGQTVSSGIVSGLARSGTATGNARGYFIQTDAPINPGNSGGALVDINGRLVGVNTAILSRSGGSNGIGFAIPSALVAQFLQQAEAGNTTFERPWAGLAGQPVTADMVEGLGLSRPGGLIISQVHPQSGFAGDIRPGDVITTVDGQPVNTPAEMLFRMSVAGLGADITLTRVRDGEVQEVTLALAAAPDTPPRAQTITPDGAAIPGVTLSTINPAVLAEFDLPLGAKGVLVDDPGQIGARAGLRAGDILRSIDGVDIADTTEAEDLLLNARGRLSLEVQRGTRRVVMRFRL
ncbi:MAG: trypsin-like peptidase domain-containing protein [Pseudomonadota bacterium]|uniref:trypsin-like peptidase domain-containing protein n=1 Tax=Roseovarius TaxID=74030 RepID=UPI0022A81EF8|nr:trypsin-like peptidase domain-containing protein [Roseovarius sp. EGI FJ00037]MCZ0813141.1 trypsin-like peptidase domain-containing protein [Roseovarius sp. EGI FJ00037]